MKHVELKLTERESKVLRQALKFTLGSLFVLDLPNDPDYRGYRVKKAELAQLINHGLRDVWSVAKKLDAAMKM
jgi:hypothetical protein